MNIEAVLSIMSSQGLIRLNRKMDKYYSVYCPIHNGGNERKPSCGVLLETEYRNGRKYPQGSFHCFSCSWAKSLPDTLTEIFKIKGIPKTGNQWLQENVAEYDPNIEVDTLLPPSIMQVINSKYAVDYVSSKLKTNQSYISEEELQSYRYTVPYMYERKLTDEIIEKFDVGYDGNWIPEGRKKPIPCITFPVRDIKGNTLFICRRSIEGKIYNYPKGTVKSVYGIDVLTKDMKSVIICESIINALTCWGWGYPAVALLGTGNTHQVSQLRQLGIRDFVLCMDGDEAGHKATAKLKKALQEFAIVWVVNMPDGKDVNDCTKEEFEELYNHKE